MKNYYKKSEKKFKKMLKSNPKITIGEWNEYAHKNNYFSAFTLECHNDANSFEELKEKMKD